MQEFIWKIIIQSSLPIKILRFLWVEKIPVLYYFYNHFLIKIKLLILFKSDIAHPISYAWKLNKTINYVSRVQTNGLEQLTNSEF